MCNKRARPNAVRPARGGFTLDFDFMEFFTYTEAFFYEAGNGRVLKGSERIDVFAYAGLVFHGEFGNSLHFSITLGAKFQIVDDFTARPPNDTNEFGAAFIGISFPIGG